MEKPTDEELELTKGMPPFVAAGFINARRKSTDWAKTGQEIQDLMEQVFKKAKTKRDD